MAYEVYIRSIVDLDKPVYLDDLSPWEKLLTSIRWKLYKSEASLERQRKKDRREALKRKNKISKLKKDIKEQIDTNLFNKDHEFIKIIINKRYNDVLIDAINSSSFLQYDIEMVRNKASSFIDLPIVIKIKRKEI